MNIWKLWTFQNEMVKMQYQIKSTGETWNNIHFYYWILLLRHKHHDKVPECLEKTTEEEGSSNIYIFGQHLILHSKICPESLKGK